MAETELKFTLDTPTADRLQARLAQLSPIGTPPDQRTLRSVYFDTKTRRLRRAGIALRLRQDGDHWIQTVKAKATNKTGLQTSQEAECLVPNAQLRLKRIPDKDLRKSVKSLIGGRKLLPICETDIGRTIVVMHKDGGTEVEVALDRGSIKAGTASRPFQELELELKSGDLAALYSLAAELLPNGGLNISRLSKSERGYRLADTGHITTPLAPRNAEAVALSPSMTTAQAAQTVLQECAEQILVNLMVVRRSDDAEGPHQLRIGLRRLRSAIELFHPLLKGPTLDRLKSEAKWLGQMVGRQRDLDVAVVDLLAPASAAAPQNAGLRQLCRLAEHRTQANRPVLRDVLETNRAQRFALDLAAFVETTPWTQGGSNKINERPISWQLQKALDKSWAKAERRAQGIATLDFGGRHELRKALKGLRYQIEFAMPLFDQHQVETFVKRLKKLQTVFGNLNDFAMLKGLFRAEDGTLPNDPSTRDALADLLSNQNAAADQQWARAQTLWGKVAGSPAFWR